MRLSAPRVHAAYDFLRGAGRRLALDRLDTPAERGSDCDRSPLDQLIEKERWNHLNELLAEFSDKDRTFLLLYYGQGMDAASVAGEMAISLKTVYSKKHKIRAHLVRCLESVRGGSPIADLLPASI